MHEGLFKGFLRTSSKIVAVYLEAMACQNSN